MVDDNNIESFIKENTYFKRSRLPSLYSDFKHLNQLNPDGYDANLTAWSNLFISIYRQGKLPNSILTMSTTNPNLEDFLSIQVYGKPKALGLIIEELVNRKILIRLNEYEMTSNSFDSLVNAKLSVLDYISPFKWVEWGLASLGLLNNFEPYDKNGKLKNENYISWDIIIEKCDSIYSTLKQKIDDGNYSSILFDDVTLFDLIKNEIEPKLSELDFRVLLTYYSRDHKVIKTKNIDNRKYIKLYELQNKIGFSFQNKLNEDITEEDIGIIKLKSNIKNLYKRNIILEDKVDHEIPQKIKALIESNKNNDKTTRIKNWLLKKRSINKSLEKSIEIHDQLNSILLKINDANINLSIMESLKQSSNILKNLNSKISLDEIDEIKLKLDEEIAQVDETNDALESNNNYDEDELNEELDKLYKQENKFDDVKQSNPELLDKLRKLNIEQNTNEEVQESNDQTKSQVKEAIAN